MITLDGKIENFLLQPTTDQEVSAFCEHLFEFQPTLEDGQLIAQSGNNKVDGFFGTDGKFHGTYSITECGQWRVSSQEGSWDAEWVSDELPLP